MPKTATVPTHLGLILDGNRRWARSQGLPIFEGHRQGYDNLKDIAKEAFNRGVKYVSAYVFSTENWERTKGEVTYLMNLIYRLLTNEIDELNRENIKLVWLGNASKLSKKLIKAVDNAESLTKNNTGGILCFCFNYGGYQEIVDAFKTVISKGISEDEVTPHIIADSLYAPEVPPVDLVVRTSGEQRISGFMLWRVAYAELYFVDKHWPDFTAKDLDEALVFYANRERRFGQ